MRRRIGLIAVVATVIAVSALILVWTRREARKYSWTLTIEPTGQEAKSVQIDLRKDDDQLSQTIEAALAPVFESSASGETLGKRMLNPVSSAARTVSALPH